MVKKQSYVMLLRLRHWGTGVCVGVVALGKDSGYSGFLGHILTLLRNKCDLGEKM